MQLKLNLPVPKTSSAIKFYKNIFNGKIIKEGKNDGHAYIQIFGQISLHVHSTNKIMLSRSYFIIRFDKNEKSIYEKCINKLTQIVDIEITTFNDKKIWGTTQTEFIDRHGYHWVLEIDSY